MHGDRPGGSIRWRMHLPVAPERVYRALDSDEGRASFWAESAVEQEGHTDLLLVHDGIDAADWYEVHAGWLNVLFPLKAMLVFGVDLRNHDPARSWDQGYADQ